MGKKNGGERENGRNALLENGGWVDKRASGKGGMYIGAVIGGSLDWHNVAQKSLKKQVKLNNKGEIKYNEHV